jgi:hypothetical protein
MGPAFAATALELVVISVDTSRMVASTVCGASGMGASSVGPPFATPAALEMAVVTVGTSGMGASVVVVAAVLQAWVSWNIPYI